MCGIVGILSKKERNVAPLIGKMLSCMKNRGPDGMGLSTGDQIVYSDTFDNLLLSQVEGHDVLGHSPFGDSWWFLWSAAIYEL